MCCSSCGLGYVVLVMICVFGFFFFKQKTAYEMRISDWSSDVCSSDLVRSLSGILSGCLSGLFADILIFVVIADSYARPALSGCPFDHLFGLQTGQKPLNRARRPSPCHGELRAGIVKVSPLNLDRYSPHLEFRRVPSLVRTTSRERGV